MSTQSSDYQIYRQRQIEAAQIAFDKWFNEQNTETKLAAEGLSPYDDTCVFTNNSNVDPSTSASVEAEFQEDPIDLLCEKFNVTRTTAKAIYDWHTKCLAKTARLQQACELSSLIAAIVTAENPKMVAAAIAYSADLPICSQLGSQTEFAKSINVTRQAVSKESRKWHRLLSLRKNPNLKSDKQCEALSQIQTDKHWRKKPIKKNKITQILKKCKS